MLDAQVPLSRLPLAEGPVHILLVEDDPVISRMLEELLVENGFATSVAASAQDMDLELERGAINLIYSTSCCRMRTVSASVDG